MPDTIVNIVDFGAVPGGAGFADVNAIAFRSALATGSRRIFIPAGSWWFNELIDPPNRWLPFGVEVFGEGVNLTVLNYLPVDDTVPFFKAYPGSSTPPYARSTFHDFTVYGRVTPAVNTPPIGTAFDLDNTPGAPPALQPQWSMTGANNVGAGNFVDFDVRVKAWILRL